MRGYLLILQTLLRHDILLAFGGIEIHGQFDSLGLIHSEGEVRLLLQILKLEPLQVLLSESFAVELACSRSLLVLSDRGAEERLLLTTKNISKTDFVTYNELFMFTP